MFAATEGFKVHGYMLLAFDGHYKGFQLSSGKQQMLAIARALMLNPSLMLLDELSEGLAALIAEEIVNIIKMLKGEALAILLIDQNFGAALALDDIHYVLSKGEVCFTGGRAALESNERIVSEHLSA